jgi:hypothetical protein
MSDIHKGPHVYFRPTEAKEPLDWWDGWQLGNLLRLWNGPRVFTRKDVNYLEGIRDGGDANWAHRWIAQLLEAIALHGSVEVFVENGYEHKGKEAALD